MPGVSQLVLVCNKDEMEGSNCIAEYELGKQIAIVEIVENYKTIESSIQSRTREYGMMIKQK